IDVRPAAVHVGADVLVQAAADYFVNRIVRLVVRREPLILCACDTRPAAAPDFGPAGEGASPDVFIAAAVLEQHERNVVIIVVKTRADLSHAGGGDEVVLLAGTVEVDLAGRTIAEDFKNIVRPSLGSADLRDATAGFQVPPPVADVLPNAPILQANV